MQLRKKIFVAGILIVIALLAVFVFSYFRQSATTRAAGNLTRQLTLQTMWHQSFLNRNKTVSLDQLRATAEKRKQSMLVEAKANPKSFIAHTLAAPVRAQVPQEIKDAGLIEEEKQVAGNLVEVHLDNLEGETLETELLLEEATSSYRLHFTEKPQTIPRNIRIAAFGTSLDSELVVVGNLEGENVDIQSVEAEQPRISIGDKKIAVIFLNFDNDQREPVDINEVRQSIFGSNQSVLNFYRENSYNQLNFTSADFFGYYTVPYNNNSGCNYYDWATAADALVYNQGVDLNSYDFRMYFFPTDTTCTSGAWATVSSTPARTWYNTGVSPFVVAHELGHNLGIHHAKFYFCPFKIFDIYENCQVMEYGDSTDVMGGGPGMFHFNAPHKYMAGWLSPDQMQTISQSGTYTIDLIETQTAEVKLLQIPLSTFPGSYFIGYRQPVGFDTVLSAGSTGGAHVHRAYAFTTATELLDMTPGTESPATDPAMQDGQIFTDVENGVTITQLNHNTQSVTVDIQIDNSICRPLPLLTTLTPQKQSGYFNETKTYQLHITNQDDPICPPAQIDLYSYYDPPKWEMTMTPQNFSLIAGASTDVQIALTPKNNQLTESTHGFYIYNTGDYPHRIDSLIVSYELQRDIGSVSIQPSATVTSVNGDPIHLSALTYSTDFQPVWSNVEYEWGLSSTNSTGTLTTNHNIATFTPLNSGVGDLYVIARRDGQTVTKSLKIEVKPEGVGLSRIEISPGSLMTSLDEHQVNLSALLYDTTNQPIWDGVNYVWGTSSINSIGTIISNNNIVSFYPKNAGQGDLFVNATYNGQTITKSMPVTVAPATPATSPTYTITDVVNMLTNYLSIDDRAYQPRDNKVNMLDFASLLQYLQ